ncbi:putative lipid kinase [Aeromicrobium marinum DSM 15272]|uniref:Lipid kinase n=1 Tax=Aeromicrobium marinum DSM 15272 TaxID=585531 RepID=E2SFK9_9ACTN|nr:diacylglycerol kinase family protein [Aeromicrobium marinum]EFQ82110.1 putative lipid kinase [Aeromicrobium marinum DSM 15272]
MSTWTVVANAKAGTSEPEAIDEVMAVLGARHDAELVETADADDLAEVLGRVADGSTVVALGGDGSLHAVVSVLDDLGRLGDVVVGLVPLGTGNDFARTIGMDRDDPAAAAAQLLEGEVRSLDLVRDGEGRVVVNAVHVGIGAEAAVEAKPWKSRLGPVGYAVGAIISGVRATGFKARVEVDGAVVSHRGRLIQVAVGNGRYIGGGTPLLPDADPGDGKLDVAVSWADARWRRVGYAWRLRKGRHPHRDDVQMMRGRRVTVTGQPSRGNLDGEVCHPAATHTWTVEPAAFRMLLPASGQTSSA